MTAPSNVPVVPDYCAPVVAHRVWNVHESGLMTGLAVAQPWRPHWPMVACCNGHENARSGDVRTHLLDNGRWLDAPVLTCACGIYAVRSRRLAESEFENWRQWQAREIFSGPRTSYAVGEVWLWGTVIEHEHGYRAQFAYPKSVAVFGEADVATKVAALYGVEAHAEMPPAPPEEEQWITTGGWITTTTISPSFPSAVIWGGGSIVLADADDDPVGITSSPAPPTTTPVALALSRAAKKLEAAARERARQKAKLRNWKPKPWGTP